MPSQGQRNGGARHEFGRTKLRDGPTVGLEREGLGLLLQVEEHCHQLRLLHVRYENAPESKWAVRRQWIRPQPALRDMTYGGVSGAWAVVDGMA